MKKNKYQTKTEGEFKRPLSVGTFSKPYHLLYEKSNPQEEFKRYGTDQKTQLYQNINNGDSNNNRIILQVPFANSSHEKEKLSFLHSRQNIQIVNKKYRQIRSSKYGKSLGATNSTQRKEEKRSFQRPVSSYYSGSSHQIKPSIKRLETTNKSKNTKIKAKNRLGTSGNGGRNSNLNRPRIDKRDIFMPELQSQSGFILHKFRNNFGKKSVQDNLHVMASVLRKKVKFMSKEEVQKYINELVIKNK